MIIDSKKYSGPCRCGKEHQMLTRMVVIESSCLKDFDSWLEKCGLEGPRAAIYDTNTYYAKGLNRPSVQQEIILDAKGLHADEKATAQVLSQLSNEIRVLVAVGSGTIHDITRYCAKKLGLSFVACPTAASVDGFCSTVCAMTWEGFKKTLPGIAPVLVLADLDVIQEAPFRLTLSGVGDIIGKYTALADWKIAHVLAGEYFCPVIEDMTRQAVHAVLGCARQLKDKDPHAYEQLTYGLLLSGLAMQMMGNSRPASGAEHHISHLLEMEPVGLGAVSHALHGEKVGVGCIKVAAEYHRLEKIEEIGLMLHPYRPLTADYVSAFFGEQLCPSILAENTPDSRTEITPSKVEAAWPEIRSVIREIPSEEELFSLYADIGAKKTLADLEVPEELLPKLLEYAPCVRNRMTFLRIRKMLLKEI